MLEDRYYMRRPSFGSHRSATVVLVVAIVLAFIVQLVLKNSLLRRLSTTTFV